MTTTNEISLIEHENAMAQVKTGDPLFDLWIVIGGKFKVSTPNLSLAAASYALKKIAKKISRGECVAKPMVVPSELRELMDERAANILATQSQE